MYLLISAILSFSLTWIILLSKKRHGHLTLDEVFGGPQKFHTHAVPRVGGVAIFTSFFLTQGLLVSAGILAKDYYLILVCAFPVFVAGLSEDLLKKIPPIVRLWASFASATFGFFLLEAQVRFLGIPYIDQFLWFTPFALTLTVFCIGGVAHAFNIIDGYNGLMVGQAIISALGVTAVSYIVNDHEILNITLVLIGSLFGFLFWNFPKGKIFAGDGGAYFIGFILATISAMLVYRNPTVSPWFVLVNVIYPVWETLFSVTRRKFFHKNAIGLPDSLHLHQLIFLRVMCHFDGWKRNSYTSPNLLYLSVIFSSMGVLFWDNTLAIFVIVVVYIILYVYIYFRIVNFRTPKLLLPFR